MQFPLMRNNILREDLDAIIAHLQQDDPILTNGPQVKAFEADGAVIMQYNEAPAGQTVFHLHFHVVPRYIGVPLRPHTGKMADGALLAGQAEKLKAAKAE